MQINTNNTKYLGLAIGIIGLLLLCLILPEAKNININQIENYSIGEMVTITGVIKNLSITKQNAFFEIENNGLLNAVYFNPPLNQMLLLRENEILTVTGKITSYKNKKELIIKEVKKID